MRVLIIALCPLKPEYGAAQLALNLAEALRPLGNEVTTWAPGMPPATLRWWHHMSWKRQELERFLEEQPAFDIIDAPPVAITRRVARSAAVVFARSVQPDLRYLKWDFFDAASRLTRRPLSACGAALYCLYLTIAVIIGWHRAAVILCLGSHEEAWMRRRFPWLRDRLGCYFAAASPSEMIRLQQIGAGRTPPHDLSTRFLWIGRWAAHKGTGRLVRFICERARTHPADRFTIAGCGRGAEGDVPTALLATGQVRLIPTFTREELYQLLDDHDAGLFTSNAEGWGLTLNEMLESGMPVFATKEGGVADLERVFPHRLRRFPPRGDVVIVRRPSLVEGQKWCSWADIAQRYDALARCRVREARR